MFAVPQDRSKVADTTFHLDRLREKGFYTDVTFFCDDAQVSAHKIVLSAGCLFFEAKFAVSAENKVEMKGTQSKTLSAILRYIYAGRFPSNFDKDVDALKSILVLGEFLQLPCLVEHCRATLMKNVSISNCLQLLDVSGNYLQGDEMQKYAGENFNKLQYTKQFACLSCEQMSTLISCAQHHQSSDVLIFGILEWVKHKMDSRISCSVRLIKQVDESTLSLECLYTLTHNKIVKASAPLANHLLSCAVSRLTNLASVAVGDSSGSLTDSFPVLSCRCFTLDFVTFETKKYQPLYYCYTFFHDDQLWSDGKNLSRMTANKTSSLSCIGNYVFYFERSSQNLITFTKFHSHLNSYEELTFPYERHDLHSVIDFVDKNLYLHVSTKLMRYNPKKNKWREIFCDLPSSPSVMVSCVNVILCVVWSSQVVVRFDPTADIKFKTTIEIEEKYKIECQQPVSVCDEKLYFCQNKNGSFVTYNCKSNDWHVAPLPEGIRHLGDEWKLCTLNKNLPCLIFVDEFNLVWEYFPARCVWKRISDNPKFVVGLLEILIRN